MPHDDVGTSYAHRAVGADCGLEAGRVTQAVADHIEPHRGNYEPFRLGKLRSL